MENFNTAKKILQIVEELYKDYPKIESQTMDNIRIHALEQRLKNLSSNLISYNTPSPVNTEIKQLLYNKGFRYQLGITEDNSRIINSLAEQRWNEGDLSYSDISIEEILTWIYKKHNIWISVQYMDVNFLFGYTVSNIKNNTLETEQWKFNSPEQTYKEAIKYTLINLI